MYIHVSIYIYICISLFPHLTSEMEGKASRVDPGRLHPHYTLTTLSLHSLYTLTTPLLHPDYTLTTPSTPPRSLASLLAPQATPGR